MFQNRNASPCMTSLFFFDDWLLHAREGLDRHQGRPERVKEVVVGSEPDPDLQSLRGTGGPETLDSRGVAAGEAAARSSICVPMQRASRSIAISICSTLGKLKLRRMVLSPEPSQ